MVKLFPGKALRTLVKLSEVTVLIIFILKCQTLNSQKIVEKFHRNRKIPANDNIAEQIFVLSEDKIQITFHRDDPNITASTRDFFKPPNAEEKGGNLQWSADMTGTFQVLKWSY